MSLLWLILALLPVLGGAERFSCRGRILGAYYADAKSGCKAFHVCVRVAGGGIRDFRFFCPPGTLFHQEAQTCTDWGDDDPLACPADIYDGQFDLYKIGSGFDTKKVSSTGNRDEEPEFGLQRAETGDKRLAQNPSQNSNTGPASDLRAAHSSDFFSGQRERGRDDQTPVSSAAPARQSFRRPTTPRQLPTTTQYTTTPVPPPPQQAQQQQYQNNQQQFRNNQQQYNSNQKHQQHQPQQQKYQENPEYQVKPQQFQQNHHDSKRKLVRKRPVYASTTLSPSTFPQYSAQPKEQFSEPTKNYDSSRPATEQAQRLTSLVTDIPPQFREYKDEYVEVKRVTPKQTKQNRYFISQSSTPFSQATAIPRNKKKDNLAELYNYEAQSTPAYNRQNENKPFKVRNSFNVDSELTQTQDFNRTDINVIPLNGGRSTPADFTRQPDSLSKNVNVIPNGVRSSPSTQNYGSSTKTFGTTPAYRNFNSVSYEPEKTNNAKFSGPKKNIYSSQTTPSTTIYTTARSDPLNNFNTVAYNTNIGFNAQPIVYSESGEDDGQYRPPAGEDDGQYRPELYERELLSGAHSLNIAASGNRLPEDQKPKNKPNLVKTAAPRPFKPAPSPSVAPSSFPTTRAPEPTYATTFRPQTSTAQRTFDYYQTYTTTSKPTEFPSSPNTQNYEVPVRQSSTATSAAPRTAEPRPTSRVPPPSPSPARASSPAPARASSPAPARPPSAAPAFAKPANKNEDNSYDYAYYDSDNGFSEYDHIEEFGRTKSRV